MIEIPKNRLETIGVWLEEWNGHKLCNIRVKASGGDAEPRWTKKGIAVQASLLDDVIKALQQVRAEAEGRGWLSSP